ncbi:hypothetical protein DM01DRAFT_1331606 [Hesseltinella vesiculosa]|uniref:F-box domain-containing protein n=1 Tax=Hesseltinella vesiculosa TaxID=101127 RepID=A0A1X2GX11_9FUNG|nr:hypothetical protein DM01DRAFT_1331606 [Hesseltinella vesiculosa]
MSEILPENIMDMVLDLCKMNDLITFSFTSRRYFDKVSRVGVWNDIMVNNGFPASLSSASAMAQVIHLHNENGLCERCQHFGSKPITPYTGSKGILQVKFFDGSEKRLCLDCRQTWKQMENEKTIYLPKPLPAKEISVKQARKILAFPHGHPYVNNPVAMLAAALRYHGGYAGIVAALQTSAYMRLHHG